MIKHKRTIDDILYDLKVHNFSTVYTINNNPVKPDLRSKANKFKYYYDVVDTIMNDVDNLLKSGIISYEDASSLYGQISNMPTYPSAQDINKALEFRRRILDIALNPDKLKNLPIDDKEIQIYLNSDIFYYFSHFAPEAARLIRQLAINNPQEFLRAKAEHELPDEWNVSDWDTITSRILENVTFYESEEQQEVVRQEMDWYKEAIHAKRPWAKLRRSNNV